MGKKDLRFTIFRRLCVALGRLRLGQAPRSGLPNATQRRRDVLRSVSHGYFVVLVLVFSAVFFTLISALSGYIFIEKRAQLAKENSEKALHIAEAGLEYYRWYLAHNPGDLQNGTGGPGPYQHAVNDPEGGTLGTFSLSVSGNEFCNAVSDITIESTGWTADAPTYKRTVRARYTKPSVAEFSHIVDSNVWAGDDRVISGPYHSNGGVRMDGVHNAPVTSGQETWTCFAGDFGCESTQTVNGVFGSGSNPELWDFPIPLVDFDGMTVDVNALQTYAETQGGLYFGPTGGQSGKHGYRATFNANGTVTVYKIKNTEEVWGYASDRSPKWQKERNVITDQQLQGTYTIPASCPVVFFRDKLWVDGTVSGKVVVVAADTQSPQYDIDTILNGNLTYASSGITDGMTIISERDILVGLQTPDIMDLHGIFVAQFGHFGRNHYDTNYLPTYLDPYATRSTLNTFGTVVSRGRVGTKWVNSGGSFVSGYSQRNDSYDAGLAAAPPPFTPQISSTFTLKLWEEVN